MKPFDKGISIDPKDILPVLKEMDSGTRIVISEAPPGAGKTFLTAFCVANAVDRREPVLVVANSYEQAYGLCDKIHALFPTITPIVYANKRRRSLDFKRAFECGFSFAVDFNDVEQAVKAGRPLVAVLRKLTVNQLKRPNAETNELLFRWMLIDEAWQIADADFAIIANLAEGFVLVGDRGQIPPIVKSDISRWKAEKDAPYRPAPEVLLSRPHLQALIAERPMTVSRRLPQRSAEIIQRIFYPRLPFTGSLAPRRLFAGAVVDPHDNSGAVIAGCADAPPAFIPVHVPGVGRANGSDVEALNAMGALADDLMKSKILVDGSRPLEERDIVLLVSRNQERRHLTTILRHHPGITIATANKFQGAERAISIVLHPLSGKTQTTAFDSDAGRLCVMLSRHTHACFVIYRDGIQEMLERSIPNAPRALGDSIDYAFAGWKANLDFARWLRESSL